MPNRMYLGGRYQYREMPRPSWAVVRIENRDFLPCTMLHPIIAAWAPNKKAALKLIREELA